MAKQLSKTMRCVEKGLYAAFTILQNNDGEMPAGELFLEIEKAITLTDWEKGFTKTGALRWKTTIQFYSLDCIAGGFLFKEKRIWHLTPKGETLLTGGREKFLDNLYHDYQTWGKSSAAPDLAINDEKAEEEIDKSAEVFFDEFQEKSAKRLCGYLGRKDPYEFQDLAAALLRGMGFYIDHVAPKGKDGGIDIIAYKNPLGVAAGRIIVQVKHTKDTVSNSEIDRLKG
ncbi:MAG: restriction endonuclease, partial [Treponema sp.]|nr:restriction endonuclease [Treponema sp.]